MKFNLENFLSKLFDVLDERVVMNITYLYIILVEIPYKLWQDCLTILTRRGREISAFKSFHIFQFQREAKAKDLMGIFFFVQDEVFFSLRELEKFFGRMCSTRRRDFLYVTLSREKINWLFVGASS